LLGIAVSLFLFIGVLYTINKKKEEIIKAQVKSFVDKKIDSLISSKGPWIDSLVAAKYNKMMADTSVQRKLQNTKKRIANIFVK
jgi:hypothetical protein